MAIARKVLTRLYELRNEAYLFLKISPTPLVDKTLYLSFTFEKRNSLNLSLQGESIGILTPYNKIKAFKKKIQHWASRVEIGRMDVFSELNDYLEENEFNQRNVKQSLISHLHNLNVLTNIFPKTLHHNNTAGYYHPSPY